MAEITVQNHGKQFNIKVKDGASQGEFRVTLSDGFHQDLTGGKISKEDCIKASFRFLLDREPLGSILGQFDLPLIGRYFPEYQKEIKNYFQ